MEKILTKIKLWYRGYVDFQDHSNDSDHPRIIIKAYPPSSLNYFISFVCKFWFRHWKWLIQTIIPIILTMIGLYIAWLAIINSKP